jgi:hypothetical protein
VELEDTGIFNEMSQSTLKKSQVLNPDVGDITAIFDMPTLETKETQLTEMLILAEKNV